MTPETFEMLRLSLPLEDLLGPEMPFCPHVCKLALDIAEYVHDGEPEVHKRLCKISRTRALSTQDAAYMRMLTEHAFADLIRAHRGQPASKIRVQQIRHALGQGPTALRAVLTRIPATSLRLRNADARALTLLQYVTRHQWWCAVAYREPDRALEYSLEVLDRFIEVNLGAP